MRWHLGASADATALVRTHSYVQGTVGRKLPAGISSDDKSLTREREREMGDQFGKRKSDTSFGPQGKQNAQGSVTRRGKGQPWYTEGCVWELSTSPL